MNEVLTKEMLEKMKAEVPSIQLKMKDGAKLSDDALEKVAGGFTESRFEKGAYTKNVVCPNCGEARWEWISDNDNDYYSWTKYTCEWCSHTFIVYNDGTTYDMNTVNTYFANNNGPAVHW